MDKILDTFENIDIKEFAKKCIDEAPAYWSMVPASSSGKYHPQYALGNGGLVRHTIAVVMFLNYMFEIESIASKFTSRERDLLRVSAIVHDMWKSGTQEDFEKSKWTKFDHPIMAANNILKMNGLPTNDLQRIATNVISHMGQWNTDKRTPDVILPKPEDKCQIILHLADYLASRKKIEIQFDEDINNMVTAPQEPPTLDAWKFTFGKYTGKTIPEVYEIDPGYIIWAKSNMEKEPAKSLLMEFKTEK